MTSPQGARAAQERNAAAVDQLETEAAVSVRAAIAAMLADVLAANGDPDDTTTPAPTVDTLAAAARQAWTRVRERIVAWVRDTFRRLLTRAVDNLPDDVAPELPPATIEDRVLALVDEVRAGLDDVPDVVASRVTTQLRDGFADGESPDQLRRRVADALGADEWAPEVARIARTTTTSVYNAAHSAAGVALEERLGKPLRRLWLATRDTRTRPTHREANGQVVESGALFRVGDALMRFPGDPLGPPEEVINCRCVVVPVVSDLVVDLAHRVTGREAAVLDDMDDMPIAASALLAATRMPPQFITYWTVGEGGARIRWNTDGDFRRCQRALRRYLDTGQVDGACANLHKLATGSWPGQRSSTSETVAASAEISRPQAGEALGRGAGLDRSGFSQVVDSVTAHPVGEVAPDDVGHPLDGVEVVRSDAPSVATQVIEVQAVGDRSDQTDVDQPVGDGGFQALSVELPISVGEEVAEPWPAARTDRLAHRSVAVDEVENVRHGRRGRGGTGQTVASVVPLTHAELEASGDMIAIRRDASHANNPTVPHGQESGIQEARAMPCPCENTEDTEDREFVADVAGDPDLSIADREREWDGDAAADRVRAWATPDGEDAPDPGQLGRAFFWRDPDADPTTEVAYKLGFADIDDGELVAVPEGIYAVASVLQGGRGGVDIPEADVDGVRERVAGYYARMAVEFDDDTLIVPWADEPAESMPDDGDMTANTVANRGRALHAAELTGGVIALIPSEADAARLAVDGEMALAADELHMTLAFLGDGERWVNTPEGEHMLRLAARMAEDFGPITARVWATGLANPETDEPDALYLAGDDTGRLALVQSAVVMGVAGLEMVPQQRSPFVAHVCTRYGDPSLDGMDQTGTDIILDRVRVAFAGNVTDFPLSGDDTMDLDEETPEGPPVEMPEDEDLTAAAEPTPVSVVADLRAANDAMAVVAEAAANAPEAPPKAWFEPVAVDGPTPPTVTAQGRVWGHIGQAGVCHVGIKDECVTIPPTRTGYGAFHRADLLTAEGDTVRVGYLYTGCQHSSLESTLDEARDYLGAACTATAAGRVYDTEYGPMFVGAVMPGVTAKDVARLWKLSGEWFTAPLELHAAVGVEQAGYPVDGTGESILVSDVDPEPALAADGGQVDVAGVVAAHRRRAAMRTAGPVVAAAARNRADRLLAGYTRRGV